MSGVRGMRGGRIAKRKPLSERTIGGKPIQQTVIDNTTTDEAPIQWWWRLGDWQCPACAGAGCRFCDGTGLTGYDVIR